MRKESDAYRFGYIDGYLKGKEDARKWIPVLDGEGQMPEVDDEGCSKYILLSFSNVTGYAIGNYKADENGGAFYDGDDTEPLTKIGVFVNAWMPLPEPYQGEGEQDE